MNTVIDYMVSQGGTASLDHIAGKFHVKKAQLVSAGFTVSAPDEKGHSTVSCSGLTGDGMDTPVGKKRPVSAMAQPQSGQNIAPDIMAYIEQQGGSVSMDVIASKFHVKKVQLQDA